MSLLQNVLHIAILSTHYRNLTWMQIISIDIAHRTKLHVLLQPNVNHQINVQNSTTIMYAIAQ